MVMPDYLRGSPDPGANPDFNPPLLLPLRNKDRCQSLVATLETRCYHWPFSATLTACKLLFWHLRTQLMLADGAQTSSELSHRPGRYMDAPSSPYQC